MLELNKPLLFLVYILGITTTFAVYYICIVAIWKLFIKPLFY